MEQSRASPSGPVLVHQSLPRGRTPPSEEEDRHGLWGSWTSPQMSPGTTEDHGLLRRPSLLHSPPPECLFQWIRWTVPLLLPPGPQTTLWHHFMIPSHFFCSSYSFQMQMLLYLLSPPLLLACSLYHMTFLQRWIYIVPKLEAFWVTNIYYIIEEGTSQHYLTSYSLPRICTKEVCVYVQVHPVPHCNT